MADIKEALDAALEGGPERHRKKVAEQEKLPVRERVAKLLDADSLAEEGLLANWEQEASAPTASSRAWARSAGGLWP